MTRFYGYNVGGTPPPREWEIVRVGNAHGRIAVYFNEREARDLANLYGSGDAAYGELLDAIEQAYPEARRDADK